MFNRDDIKAGYLLEVLDYGKTYFMTVLPAKQYDENIELACCNLGVPHNWWPVSAFDKDLTYLTDPGTKVVRIYGYACNGNLLKNSPENRELLWERKERKRMTVAEICKELGYDVEIVKEN